MSIPVSLHRLAGSWRGTSTLVLPWLPEPESTSESTVTVTPIARGKFLRIDYTWEHEGQPQEGTLLVGRAKSSETAQIVWCDSWHQNESCMVSAGPDNRLGYVEVVGHYPAPEGPEWGWRTLIRPSSQPSDNEGWELVMHNISPQGEETLAFRNVYTRA
jgi:hypothetical protein